MVLIAHLTVTARSASSCLTTDSTLAIISVAGVSAVATAKFRPFFSRDTLASVRDHIVPRDLQVPPPVPTKGARRVAELASMRFLRERIRLMQRAKGNVNKEVDVTAQSVTCTLSAEDAAEVLDKIRSN